MTRRRHHDEHTLRRKLHLLCNHPQSSLLAQVWQWTLTVLIVLSIFVYAALGKLADSLTRLLERRLLRWNPAYASA